MQSDVIDATTGDSQTRRRKDTMAALTLGALGVVFGDIGTSPIYAFREALGQAAADGISASEILGVLSLALWALILVVTCKYPPVITLAPEETLRIWVMSTMSPDA